LESRDTPEYLFCCSKTSSRSHNPLPYNPLPYNGCCFFDRRRFFSTAELNPGRCQEWSKKTGAIPRAAPAHSPSWQTTAMVLQPHLPKTAKTKKNTATGNGAIYWGDWRQHPDGYMKHAWVKYDYTPHVSHLRQSGKRVITPAH